MCAIVVAMTIATLLSVSAIRNIGNSSSDQMLYLLCETGEKNLDSYFESVEQSVELVSSFVKEDLEGLEPERLQAHIERAKAIFARTAANTHGVLTYYYRIDPAVSDTVKGFWFTHLEGETFQEHEVTDITRYDTEDTSQLVWFTVPKATGEAVWLPPYITDNLDVRVLSYNVPIYWNGRFIGVVGIEIDYSTMAEQVDNIKLYDNGYAFINDAEGKIIYHPRMDVAAMAEADKPVAPAGLVSPGSYVRYTYEGVEKQAVWLPLSNGMRLNVTVPISEINRNWHVLINRIFLVMVALLVVFIVVTLRFTGQITKPLRQLTEAAKQVNAGNYDVALDYKGNDEVGILTRAFSQLTGNLKVYISDLNDLAYADALTSVRNKGAYDIFMRKLQGRLTDGEAPMEFAVGIFDCDNLKDINDEFGHDKGDIYLKTASRLICRVYQHSPVFRTGGDEFAVILQNDDYRNREALAELFRARCAQSIANAASPWEQARVAMGVAVFDPERDRFVSDVARRADQLMYEDKRTRKVTR